MRLNSRAPGTVPTTQSAQHHGVIPELPALAPMPEEPMATSVTEAGANVIAEAATEGAETIAGAAAGDGVPVPEAKSGSAEGSEAKAASAAAAGAAADAGVGAASEAAAGAASEAAAGAAAEAAPTCEAGAGLCHVSLRSSPVQVPMTRRPVSSKAAADMRRR